MTRRKAKDIDFHDLILEYPFPLRSDCDAILRLPCNLTRKEVKRIQAWLESMVQEDRRVRSATK
jgi:hypothetical protein